MPSWDVPIRGGCLDRKRPQRGDHTGAWGELTTRQLPFIRREGSDHSRESRGPANAEGPVEVARPGLQHRNRAVQPAAPFPRAYKGELSNRQLPNRHPPVYNKK